MLSPICLSPERAPSVCQCKKFTGVFRPFLMTTMVSLRNCSPDTGFNVPSPGDVEGPFDLQPRTLPLRHGDQCLSMHMPVCRTTAEAKVFWRNLSQIILRKIRKKHFRIFWNFAPVTSKRLFRGFPMRHSHVLSFLQNFFKVTKFLSQWNAFYGNAKQHFRLIFSNQYDHLKKRKTFKT